MFALSKNNLHESICSRPRRLTPCSAEENTSRVSVRFFYYQCSAWDTQATRVSTHEQNHEQNPNGHKMSLHWLSCFSSAASPFCPLFKLITGQKTKHRNTKQPQTVYRYKTRTTHTSTLSIYPVMQVNVAFSGFNQRTQSDKILNGPLWAHRVSGQTSIKWTRTAAWTLAGCSVINTLKHGGDGHNNHKGGEHQRGQNPSVAAAHCPVLPVAAWQHNRAVFCVLSYIYTAAARAFNKWTFGKRGRGDERRKVLT